MTKNKRLRGKLSTRRCPEGHLFALSTRRRPSGRLQSQKLCSMCMVYIGSRNDIRVMRCKPCQKKFIELVRKGKIGEIMKARRFSE